MSIHVFFKKPQREIKKIFIHCSASDNPKHDDVSVIRDWHIKRGFSEVGYHYFIKKDGTIQLGRSIESIPAAQQGHNMGSAAICLSGLQDFSDEQFDVLKALCAAINSTIKVTFHGHREVANKLCPNFDYKAVLGLDDNGKMKG